MVSLYGAALHSRDERVRELYSTLEAKQFVLALVRSKRVEDANAVAQLLHDKLNVGAWRRSEA